MLIAAVFALAPADTANWMDELYASRPDTRLTDMVIPGTHDSGAYKIDTEGKCKITPIAGINPVMAAPAKSNPCMGGKLAKAQSKSFASQLNGGIRYLDMRLGVPENKVVSKKKAGKKLTNKAAQKVPIYLQHTFISVRFTKALNQIVKFAKEHPKEQVILDFQHIDLTGKKKKDKYYKTAINKILRTYKVGGTTACSRSWRTSATTTSLGQAWAADRNLVILYAKGELPKNSCYQRREPVLYSPWPNTDDPAVSAAKNLEYLQARKQALAGNADCSVSGGNQCGLFVNQMQLSMPVLRQAQCLSSPTTPGCSLRDLAEQRNPKVVPELTDWRQQGLPTNISIVDFYEIGDTVAGLIALNQE